MKKIPSLFLLIGLGLGSAAVAMPVVTVTSDEAELSSKISLPLVGGGHLQQLYGYKGPSIPVGPFFELEPLLSFGEDTAGDDHALWATSRFDLATSAGFGIEVWSQAEQGFDVFLGADGLAWDSLVTPTAQASSTLRWRFNVSQQVTVSVQVIVKGTAGYAAARLVDKTTGDILVQYATSNVETTNFDNLVLQAGHEYHFAAVTREAALDDDDESAVYLFFNEAVEITAP